MKKIKNGTDITKAFARMRRKGGSVYLPAGEYSVRTPILMDSPSIRLRGEVWAYNLDPNGVFETRYGSKLKLDGREDCAISVGSAGLPAGLMISDIGIQGQIVGMDTRGLFDVNRPYASAGVYFGGERVDQGDFSKISCCGLAAGISMAGSSEIDACDFHKINVDGCCVGIYFAPRASYYVRFNRCVVADNPSYGFFGDATNACLHNMDIAGTHFVRNCGQNHIKDMPQAAVLLKDFSRCTFRDNLIDDPGTFWYFEATATDNADKTVYQTPTVGLYLIGNENRLFNNTFTNSSRESAVVKGRGNVLIGNIADGDIVVEGEGNVINGLVLTRSEAKLVLKGAAAESTLLLGIDDRKVVKVLS